MDCRFWRLQTCLPQLASLTLSLQDLGRFFGRENPSGSRPNQPTFLIPTFLFRPACFLLSFHVAYYFVLLVGRFIGHQSYSLFVASHVRFAEQIHRLTVASVSAVPEIRKSIAIRLLLSCHHQLEPEYLNLDRRLVHYR